jgi:hypothetical protein
VTDLTKFTSWFLSLDSETQDQVRKIVRKPRLHNSIPEVPLDQVQIEIPTNCTGTLMPITKSKVSEWEISYPQVDVPATLLEIRQWCIDNPTRRKTASGMYSFISRWLSKEQNR